MKTTLYAFLIFLALTGCSSNTTTNGNSASLKVSPEFSERRHATYLYGVEQEKKHNYTEAFKAYKKTALDGHFMAQINLGKLYYEGKGVTQNYKKAVYWSEKSANKSYDPTSLYNLAQCYRLGRGVKSNYPKALNFYRESAKQGYASAQFSLGVAYDQGTLNVKKNENIAKDYYLDAANQGHTGAQNNLGMLYQEAGNKQKAKNWFLKAANQGNKLAIENLAKYK